MKFLLLFSLIFNFSIASATEIKGFDLITKKNVEFNTDKNDFTVYYFLSAWCPCSQGTFDHLNTLQKKYTKIKFVGFHSSVDIPKKDALNYFSKYTINFPIIFDNNVKYADLFKALKTPHVFIIGKDNKVVFQGGAANSRNLKKATKFYLSDALASISRGEDPKVKNAKALGCYIAR